MRPPLLSLATALAASALIGSAAAQDFSRNRRYDQYTYLSSHNSYANVASGYVDLTANQNLGSVLQASLGVRCFLLDVYLMKQRVNGAVQVGKIYKTRAEALADTSETGALSVVVAHKPDEWSFLLIAPRSLHRSLTSELNEIAAAMDGHPNDIFTIVFESYVEDDSVIQAFPPAMRNRIFYADRPNVGFPAPFGFGDWDVRKHGWPTVGRMRDEGRRLVVFSSDPRADEETTKDGFPYQWRHMSENIYGDDSCYVDESNLHSNTRTESDALNDFTRSLVAWNYFPTFNSGGDSPFMWNPTAGLHQYVELNALSRLTNFAIGIQRTAERLPNFLNVDYVEFGKTSTGDGGGPRAMTDLLNIGWDGDPVVGPNFSTSEPVPSSGWFRRRPNVTISGDLRFSSRMLRYWSQGAQSSSVETVQDVNAIEIPLTGEGTTIFAAELVCDLSNARPVPRTARSAMTPFTIKLDSVAPTTSHVIDGREIVLSGSDATSGIARYETRVGPADWSTAPGGRFLATSRGRNVIRYRSVDIAGNASEERVAEVPIPRVLRGPLTVERSGLRFDRKRNSFFQTLTVRNSGGAQNDVSLVLSGLTPERIRSSVSGATRYESAVGSAFLNLGTVPASGVRIITLEYRADAGAAINFTPLFFGGEGAL